MKALLERIFGSRLDEDPDEEETQIEKLQEIAVSHEATLRAVERVLSRRHVAIATAVEDTVSELQRRRSRRKR